MNNIAEYEALIQGLKKEIDLGAKALVVLGDYEIIIRQVRNTIHCIAGHLKNYQIEVWNLLSSFEAFNINSIPCYLNQEADLLANVASRLIPSEGIFANSFSVELLFRPSIPNNIVNWRVFDREEQLIDFLTMKDTFKDVVIDEMTHDEDLYNFVVIHKPC